MQGVILAAGKGKRLHPLTLRRSKAMAPVAGKPIVARVLEMLQRNGIRDFIVLVSPDDQEIVPYFQARLPHPRPEWAPTPQTREGTVNGQMEYLQLSDQQPPPHPSPVEGGGASPITIRFITQSERLGMAHALRLAAPYIHGPFVMSACDNLTPPEHVGEMIATYRQGHFNAVLSLMEIDIAHSASTGIIEWENQLIRRIVEKPQPAEAPSNISSLPLYLFAERLLDYLPAVQLSARGEYELQDAIQLLIEHAGGVTGVLTPSRVQLTTTADLLALNRHYLEHDPAAAQVLSQPPAAVELIPPVHIAPGVTLAPGSVIGPHVVLEEGCHIGAGAQIREAVILRNSHIAPGQQIVGEVVMSEHEGG